MDPRKNHIQEQRTDGNEEVTGSIASAEHTRDYILWILDFHNIPLSRARIIEIGSGTGYLLDSILEKWIDIVWIDARPRPFKDTLPIKEWHIESLSEIFGERSFDAVISSNVFDTAVYNQEKEKMLTEIERVLNISGMYVGKEPNDLTLRLPECEKRIYGWWFQVFRKWYWFLADAYDFSWRINK